MSFLPALVAPFQAVGLKGGNVDGFMPLTKGVNKVNPYRLA